jgi:hypothetical protein
MIMDCRDQLFTKQVIRNVTSRAELVGKLEPGEAVEHRSDARAPEGSAVENPVESGVPLPTASSAKAQTENKRCLSIAAFHEVRQARG